MTGAITSGVAKEIIHETSAQSTRRHELLILLFVLCFATEFVVRGPIRFFQSGFVINDFIPPLIQSRALLKGKDPYDSHQFLLLWPKDSPTPGFLVQDAAAGNIVAKDGIPSPYPLSCLAILAPISGLPWHAIRVALLVVNCLSSALLIAVLLSLAKAEIRDARTHLFCGLALGFAPLHTAVAGGNLAVIVCSAGVAAIWCSLRDYKAIAGILLALAICLKPPLGLIFLAHSLFRRRWRATLVGVVLSSVVTGAAILRLWAANVDWFHSYSAVLRTMFSSGGINDFSSANALRFHLLNLQMPLYSLTGNAALATTATWGMVTLLVVSWMGLALRCCRGTEILELSAIASIALLPVYHRFVDATLLILPLCWCLLVREGRIKLVARSVMLLLLPFLLPGASMLAVLASRHPFFHRTAERWWWNAILIPHETWAVLIIAVLLLYAMYLQAENVAFLVDERSSRP